MTEKNKIIRAGVDSNVTVSTAINRSKYDPALAESMRPVYAPNRHSVAFKKKIRSWVRGLLAFLKPVTHPIMFRLRNYLNQPVIEQLARIDMQLQHLERIGSANPWATQLDRIEQYVMASARRVAINCDAGEILVRTEVGYILCPSSDHALLSCLLEAGELERGTRLVIQRLLKPGDVFIDVGANLGMITLAAAYAMQGKGRILSFEPFEPTQRLLTKSVWMNGFSEMVEIHQAAVSNRDGHQTLHLGATSGHNSLYHLDAGTIYSTQSVEVPLVRLDSVLSSNTHVDLVKIDVEGAELDVLESASAIIASNPAIALIVEFGYAHLIRTGHTTKDWLDAFKNLGLEYKAIDELTGELKIWTDKQIEEVDSVNLFFARPQSTAWSRVQGMS
jgi:FkbM family methyltransferase